MDSTAPGTHNWQMDVAFISAFSALAGSVVGGLTSGTTTWMSLRSQARTGHRLHKVAQREDLYRDFVIAASEMYGRSIFTEEPKIQDVVVLYSMVSRMRILSSSAVVSCAEKTIDTILDTYCTEKKTVQEIRALMRSGEAVDPLKEFSETTREELRAF